MKSHTTEEDLSVDNAVLDVLDCGTVVGGTADVGTHDSVCSDCRQSCSGRVGISGCGVGSIISVSAII